MNQTSLIGLFVLTFLAVWIKPAQAAERLRPNIVLAMADDMGWGDVAYNGHPVIQTPNLDAMSATGLRFDRFYAPTVCSPTRGSCLTGRHPFRYGIVNANVGRLPERELTLAEALKANGYTAGHFGKWHLGTLTNDQQDGRRGGRDPLAYSPPWLHGFDVSFSTEQAVPTWDPMVNQPFLTRFWTGPGAFATDNLQGDASRVVMDRAVDFIRQAVSDEKPFLACVWFHAPHLPVKAGDSYRQMYAQQRSREQHYYGCITALDEQMGRLRAELKQLGVADNTLVWFVSDNGPEGQAGEAPGSAGPLRGRKRDLWEGGIRVPAILEYPALVKAHRVIDTPCVTSDFLPTILDLAGISIDAPQPIDGENLRPLIADQSFRRTRGIGFEYAQMAAWIDGQHKLVALLDDKPGAPQADRDDAEPLLRVKQLQLFDIAADPAEQHELAAQYPERVKDLAAMLSAWRQSCRASYAETRSHEPSVSSKVNDVD